jgi:hypothetical protein
VTTKVRTEGQLQDCLDADFAWRIKEIDHIKDQLRRASGELKPVALRSGIPLLYAHWEGFIKSAAEAFISFVAHQGHDYGDLAYCFVAHGLADHLETLEKSKKNAARAEAVRFVLSSLKQKASVPWKRAVQTRSNLNSEVFVNIASAIGLSTAPYEPRFNLIDESLLKRRNTIAHGQWLDVDEAGFLSLTEEVITLLRAFKTDLQNAASLKSYLLPRPSARQDAQSG